VRWLVLVAVLSGCAAPEYVAVRETPRSPLADTLRLASREGPQPSDRTLQVARRYDLIDQIDQLRSDPCELLDELQTYLNADPSPELLYAFTELSFLAAKQIERSDSKLALDLYGSAVAHAYIYLFDSQLGFARNPYDPQFRSACDLYNGALEGALRLVRQQGDLLPGSNYRITTAGRTWDVSVVARGGNWFGHDFERFEFVSDYEVAGLANSYQTFGLGVPLVAVRKKAVAAEQPLERCYPPNLSFPATAFLRVLPPTGEGEATHQRALLELYDPLTATDVMVQQGRVPLESDLTTPLAYFLNNAPLSQLSTLGLLKPEESQAVRGLYMVQPYQPGKIPVIMVHGLWSSPLTWMEMFNDLRAAPELRAAYQFWFYLYPSGQPFWQSAAQMRQDLAALRQVIDPLHQERSLDHLVLVGHSMGGLVSRMQTIDSGDRFWQIVSDRPFEELKAEPATKQQLHDLFYFQSNPSVERLITIGTPHRGSQFANGATRWLGQKLISMPQMVMATQQQIFRDNPEVFRDTALLRTQTSIDSLSPSSPVFPVILASPRPGLLKHHNIVGVIEEPTLLDKLAGEISGDGDGVVSFESAHLDDATSELVVDADHQHVHQHPKAVLEVRRILLEHLQEISPQDRLPGQYTVGLPRVDMATRRLPATR